MFPNSLLPGHSSTFRPHISTMTSILLVTLSRINSRTLLSCQALQLDNRFCCLRPTSRRAWFANSLVVPLFPKTQHVECAVPRRNRLKGRGDRQKKSREDSLFSSLKSFGCLGTAQRCELLTMWIFGNWHWDISSFASFESRVLWRGK